MNVAVTGGAWMGSGVGSIESALTALFREAEEEVTLTAYAISDSADLLFDMLDAALARGIQVKLIVNRLSGQPARAVGQLRALAQIYPHLHLYDFTLKEGEDLHAKVIVADRRRAMVGSSNLSRRGLIANHELAVLIEGAPAEEIARVLEFLCSRKYAWPVSLTP